MRKYLNKLLMVLLCACVMVVNSYISADAIKNQDVTLEVLTGKKWKETNGKKLKLHSEATGKVKDLISKSNKNYHSDELRLVNNTDQKLEYTIIISKVQGKGVNTLSDSIEWTYVSEEESTVLNEFSGVLNANETSSSFSINSYMTNNLKVESIDITVETKVIEEVSETPYYAINTDVDLVIDEEGKTIKLNDCAQNYLASVDGQKITYSNATVTGNTYAFTFGIHRGAAYCNYNNEINNVNIVDLVVGNGVLNGSDKVCNAVYVYGNSVLNNCNMTGTTSTAEGYNVYDVGFVNKSVTTINGGNYGSIYVWSQAHLTINDANVDLIDCSTITTRNLGMLTIGAGTHVGTINLTTAGYSQYQPALTIEKGATVDQIIYRGKTYSQKEWNNPFYGKYISIIGDSISTYAGYSDAYPITSEDCVNRFGEAYYGPVGGDYHNTDLLVNDTWWYQAADELGAEILMSNAGNSTGLLCASYPQNADWDLYLKEMLAYKSRPYYLGRDGKTPDIIALYIGSNEIARATTSQFGTIDDVDFDTLIKENADGTFTYATPETVVESYCILLHKVQQTYPEAEIYCFSVVPNAGGYLSTVNKRMPTTVLFNNMLKGVVDYYDVHLVDIFDEFGLDPDGDGKVVQEDFDRFQTYYHNDPHPNAAGFDIITNRFVKTILEESKYN